MNQLAQQMHDYHVWANRKWLEHVNKTADIFRQPMPGVFPTIARTFGHIFDVDTVWFNRIVGNSLPAIGTTEFASTEEAIQALGALHEKVAGQLAERDDMLAIVRYANTAGQAFENRLMDVLVHMVNHGTYHRGNVADMVRQAGLPGCSTDYVFYLRR